MNSLQKPKLVRMQTDCPGYDRVEEERLERENREYWARVLCVKFPPPPELIRSTNKPPEEATLLDEPAFKADEPEPLDGATLEVSVPNWSRHDTSIGGLVAERAV